jgi:hypothetical protein
MSFGNTNSVNLPSERPMSKVQSNLEGMQKNNFYMSSPFNKPTNNSETEANDKQAQPTVPKNINLNPELIANQINFLA